MAIALPKGKKNVFLETCTEVCVDTLADDGFWVLTDEGGYHAIMPYKPWMDEEYYWLGDLRERFSDYVAEHGPCFVQFYTRREGEAVVVWGFFSVADVAAAQTIRESLRVAMHDGDEIEWHAATEKKMKVFMDAADYISKLPDSRVGAHLGVELNVAAVKQLAGGMGHKVLAGKCGLSGSGLYRIYAEERCRADSTFEALVTALSGYTSRPADEIRGLIKG